MTTWILLLSLLPGTDTRLLVAQMDEMSTAQLEAKAANSPGHEPIFAHLLLAATDTSHNASVGIARAGLDSLYRAAPEAWNAALLGTAEALEARRHRQDPIEATRWVSKAIGHLDEAIAADSLDPLLRVFRIHSLVEVPEIFHVDQRLRRDEARLRLLSPRLANADASTLLALAALDYRFGNLSEATAIWKLVASKTSFGSKFRAQAQRRLDALHV